MLKILLAAAIPLQGFLDKTSPTHGFINRQALAVLQGDARNAEAQWLGEFLAPFDEGCDWADTGWRNVGHMYDPSTGFGLKGWPSAPQMLREYWDHATRYFAERNLRTSFFYLGAAAHLVQDLCVPHHAAARTFAGHKRFEEYACHFRHLFAVEEGGLYNMARTPEGWVYANADYSRNHYSHCVTRKFDRPAVHAAVADLLPRAQRTTAGFVAYFLQTVGAGDNPSYRYVAEGGI